MPDNETIHIIDDEEDLARNLRDILQLHHYTVSISHTGRSALEHIAHHPTNLAIVDMNLPDRKGEDLIKEISALSSATEFIVLTGHASIESAIDAVKHKKIVAYEIKPVNINHLMTLLTQVFQRRESEELRAAAQRELEWKARVDEAIAEVSRTLLSGESISLQAISDRILDHARLLTGSGFGLVGYIDSEKGTLICPSLTEAMLRDTPAMARPIQLSMSEGFWADLMKNREPIIRNDPAIDDPEKTTGKDEPITRLIAVPALLGGTLAGQIALANKPADYDERDLALLESLASLYALAIQKRRWEEKLLSSLYEKDMLLKEVYHRVKNNLQVISSLLSLQASKLKDDSAKSAFRDSQSRIRAMALVHEKLYQSEDLSRVDYCDYVKALVKAILHSYGIPQGAVTLNYQIDPIEIPLDTAIPCGLIINELVTNSIKYAFGDQQPRELTITLRKLQNNNCRLVVADNGQGIDEHIDPGKGSTLGLQLVTALIEDQLGGTFQIKRQGGTSWSITFPS